MKRKRRESFWSAIDRPLPGSTDSLQSEPFEACAPDTEISPPAALAPTQYMQIDVSTIDDEQPVYVDGPAINQRDALAVRLECALEALAEAIGCLHDEGTDHACHAAIRRAETLRSTLHELR